MGSGGYGQCGSDRIILIRLISRTGIRIFPTLEYQPPSLRVPTPSPVDITEGRGAGGRGGGGWEGRPKSEMEELFKGGEGKQKDILQFN